MRSFELRLQGWPFALALLMLTFVPLAELALLFFIGRSIGLIPTLALCASTGFIGAWLARSQGARVFVRAQEAMSEGRFPAEEILDGAAIVAGGVLLLTPGFLTDLMGMSLLAPPTRFMIKKALRSWWFRRQGIIEVKPV